MKHTSKRMISWIMVLTICLSLLSAGGVPAQAATVDYVYAGSVIKNWGTREETATFLSPNAETFYENNGVTLSTLATLSGSGSTSGVPSSQLYQTLHALMYDNLTDYTSYEETKDLFQYTDCQNSGKSGSQISSFYSGNAIGPAWDSGNTWNREHVWPNSKSNGGSNSNTRRETDIMMLRPAAVSENSGRSNTAYGESSNFYHPNEASGGTHDLRGDVARIVLYVYTCWGGSDSYHDGAIDYMWGSSGVIESKEVLLNWIEEDPVDTWELGRNDSVESITGTRNVYVDYPELAFLLFNEEIPENYQSPSGGAIETYTVTAVSNNTAWGTVSVSGYTVTATPNTGYEVAGYTLQSGEAQVTRQGNTFTLAPTSDVTVRINFAARVQRTLTFSQFGVTAATVTAYDGDSISLPGHTGQVREGYTFLGWVENALEKTESMPTYYRAGDSFNVTRDGKLLALYSITESDGAGSADVFTPYSGALTEGDYIVVYEDAAMVAALTSGNRLQYAGVTYTGTDIVSPAANTVWHFAPVDGYWTMYNAATGTYAGGSGSSNKAALLDSVTDFAKWTETVNTDTYEFVNKGNQEKGVNPLLRKNQTYGFACYAMNTTAGGALSLYKRGAAGTTYYLTGELTVTDQEGNVYETLASALENAAQGSKLTLLKSTEEDVTVSEDVILDLCGFCVFGTVTVEDGCTLFGLDSKTDDFTVEDGEGYGKITQVVCQGTGAVTGLPEESDLTQLGYMVVQEADGVSFHCVELKLTAMSLRATQGGVYYKSAFRSDEIAADNVQQYGVALSIYAVPTAQNIETLCGCSVFTDFQNNGTGTSTLLKGIMKTANTDVTNEQNANTTVYGRAYILTAGGQYVFGASASRSLRQQTEAADTLWANLSDSQKDAMLQMYHTYESVMEAWYLPNLKGTLEPETPEQTGYVQVTSEDELTSGQYVMIVNSGYAPGAYDNGWLTAVQPVVKENLVTDTVNAVWTLTFDGDLVTITDANGVTVKPKGTNTNGITSGDYQWKWSFENGTVKFTGSGNYAITLASNATASGGNRFRGYKTGTVTGSPNNYPCQFTLYKLTA